MFFSSYSGIILRKYGSPLRLMCQLSIVGRHLKKKNANTLTHTQKKPNVLKALPIVSDQHTMTNDVSPFCDQISQLPDTDTHYYRTINALVVSIKFGKPMRLFVTDLTSNKLLRSSYSQDFSDENVSADKIMQITAYYEKYMPLVDQLISRRDIHLFDLPKSANVLDQAIFVKIGLKVKKFQNTLEGIAVKIELLTQSNSNENSRIFQNVTQGLSKFISSHRREFELTIPKPLLDSLVGASTTMEQSTSRSTPFHQDTSTSNQTLLKGTTGTIGAINWSSPIRRIGDGSPTLMIKMKQSPIPDLPSDNIHEDDFRTLTPLHSKEKNRSPATNLSEPQPKKKVKISPNYLQRLNELDDVDGKIYDLSGFIVEFEPLMNQLCIKRSIDSPPVLNPLTILITASISKGSEIPDEKKMIRISFTSRAEILNFLGMTEIEEVYIKSKEIQQSFLKILTSKKIFHFKITKKLIKINYDKNYILGWEAIGVKLDSILSSLS